MENGKDPINYDQIAPSYDQRYISNQLPGVKAALSGLIHRHKASWVLEAGCGTGHWIAALSPLTPYVFGLDFSIGMLQKAQSHLENPCLVHGRGEQLPFRHDCIDLVFVVNALHHFQDPLAFLLTCWESLKPGGCLAVIGQVPQDSFNHWYVYDYFEGTYETDIQRFHTWDVVKSWMVATGFEIARLEPVEYIRDHKAGPKVLADPFLEKNATSQLAMLTDQEYQQGIQKIKDVLQAAALKGEPPIFQVELRLDMLVGRKRETP